VSIHVPEEWYIGLEQRLLAELMEARMNPKCQHKAKVIGIVVVVDVGISSDINCCAVRLQAPPPVTSISCKRIRSINEAK
jgi:hypothetical protein